MIKIVKSIINALGLRDITLRIVPYFISIIAKIKPQIICERSGINYCLDLNELIDQSIFLFGGWESTTIKFLHEYVHDGDIVIEIGANIGAHTLIISKIVGATGRVHAFEPTEYARNKLFHNIRLNPDLGPRIEVHNHLVTNKSHELPITEINSSWRQDNKVRKPEKVESVAITIDEFFRFRNPDRVSLIKIDVDGYDYKVLQGALELIETFKPVIFIELCEYALKAQGDSVSEIFDALAERGYVGLYETGEKIESVGDVEKLIGMTTSINGVFIHATTLPASPS